MTASRQPRYLCNLGRNSSGVILLRGSPMNQQGFPDQGRAGPCLLREMPMIQLTRLNNTPLTVNSDLIKFVEQSPDTVITLVSGEKIVVRENAGQVVEQILRFRRAVLEGIYPAVGNFAAMSRSPGQQETQVTAPDEG